MSSLGDRRVVDLVAAVDAIRAVSRLPRSNWLEADATRLNNIADVLADNETDLLSDTGCRELAVKDLRRIAAAILDLR
jgi:hypothetical protein